MRVLHVHSGNLFGGIEAMLLALARRRAPGEGTEHEFALCFEGRLSRELLAAGARVHLLGPARFSRPWGVWRARRALRRVLQRGFAHVICHSPWSQALFGRAARTHGAAGVFYLHHPMRGRDWIERLARAAPPDGIIANSQFTASHSDRIFPGTKKVVAYPPVELQAPLPASERAVLRASLGATDATVVILQASRLERWKGQALLLQALAELRGVPGWALWLAGGAQRRSESHYALELERLASRLGIRERVSFLGQRGDVPRLLGAADLYCQPNTGPEPFGIAFVEALAAGLPVVATRMGAAPEIVDRTSGVLVAPEAAALAGALEGLIGDRTAREALGANGPARARALCDPAHRIPALEEVLREIRPMGQ